MSILNLYSPEYIRDAVATAQAEKGAVFFPGAFPNVPKWDDFIRVLNQQRQIEANFTPNRPEEEILKGMVFKRVESDFYFYTVGGVLEEDIKEVVEVKDTLREILGEIIDYGPHPVGTFMNFAAEGFNVPLHGDDRETFFWQCIGTTRWTISKPSSPGVESEHIMTIDMTPGDLLYLGHWVKHGIEVSGPRAGITFDARK
jgi:hypothetical protein